MYHMALIRHHTRYMSQYVSAHGIEFMFQSFFENVKFCIVNIVTVCVSKQCRFLFPVNVLCVFTNEMVLYLCLYNVVLY